ncbi:unnamed protein product [Cochlearia groenlandica]
MQEFGSSSEEFENYLEGVLDEKSEESKSIPRKILNKKSDYVLEQVYEGEEDLDDFLESKANNVNDKVDKKRQREKTDDSGLDKKKTNKKMKQEPVCDLEIEEMWDSITNDNNSKEVDSVKATRGREKTEDDYEIEKLFNLRNKKKDKKKNPAEIAMQVEEVIANLEIAVEDDVELNKQGKPAINKLMKLPLFCEALSKKQLQVEFLDHGVLNVIKNWLEPLPDGSLPNINIRTALLKILDELRINVNLDCRKEQLIKSGLGKVIMFLSKSDEETTPNRRLAKGLINEWSRGIHNKSTRYEDMCSPAEREEQHQILLRRQNKTSSKRPEPEARGFDVDVDFSVKPKCKLAAAKGVERARVPGTISMDFVIRPESKMNKQLDDSIVHENIIYKLQKRKALRKKSLQALKVSVDGRTMPKY